MAAKKLLLVLDQISTNAKKTLTAHRFKRNCSGSSLKSTKVSTSLSCQPVINYLRVLCGVMRVSLCSFMFLSLLSRQAKKSLNSFKLSEETACVYNPLTFAKTNNATFIIIIRQGTSCFPNEYLFNDVYSRYILN